MALFTVFGNPISHSLSPAIHHAFAAQVNLPVTYTRSLTSLGQFRRAVTAFFQQGGMGANVTVPFKEQACALASQRTARAQQAGAVNTLVATGCGQLLGDNTDGIGLVAALHQHCQQQLAQRAIVICGAGGAARGVIGPLLAQQVSQIIFANRTLTRAQALAAQFAAALPATTKLYACCYQHLVIPPGALVLQATSAGLHGQVLPIRLHELAKAGCFYDMQYGASATPMMQLAQQAGVAQVFDGLSMLVEQAAAAFQLWHPDAVLDTAAVLAQIRAQL